MWFKENAVPLYRFLYTELPDSRAFRTQISRHSFEFLAELRRFV